MKRLLFLSVLLASLGSLPVCAQDYGTLTYQGKTVKLTGYRTRMNNGYRFVIADGTVNDRLYSVTITLKPDVQQAATTKTDADHTVTLTISNTSYGDAQNFCFSGELSLTPKNSNLAVSGQNLAPMTDCIWRPKPSTEKLSFTMKL